MTGLESRMAFCSNGAMMNQTPIETALSRAMIRWSLSKTTLVAETPTSLLYKVEQNGRDTAALKLLKPESGADEARGGELLAWYGGEGAVTVFDSIDGAVFMEWVEGESLADLSRGGKDREATEALADVAGRLHQRRDATPPELATVRERFSALFASKSLTWPRMGRDLLARSVGIAHKLFDKPSAHLPLHGDLHHGNILRAHRGWLAVDPKGLLGDPVYDLAPAFMNPIDAPKIASNPARIAHMTEVFSARLGHKPKRLLGFAAAHAALSACWAIEDGETINTQIAVLPHLLAAYDQA